MSSAEAPGRPGIQPRWTSSTKCGVGTAPTARSRVWFTLSHGIVNEVYYPRIDQACVRDLGLLITDGRGFFSEEKRDADHETAYLAPGVPAFRLTNTVSSRYRIEKLVLTDPARDVLLQRVRFEPLGDAPESHHLYALLAPHLGNRGRGNDAWVGDYKGTPALFAQRDGLSLALIASPPWRAMSAGYVGTSDGWQDLVRHKRLTWFHERAEDGNVALTGELDLATGDTFDVALGFGLTPAEAGLRALSSLQDGFDRAKESFVAAWEDWQARVLPLDLAASTRPQLQAISAGVLRCHESKRFPGGLIASLSIPWGSARGDDDLGGYHLVWPRDLVESAGAFAAVGLAEEVGKVLGYLRATQEADGHWAQNMWLDGTPYWNGIQMDETAFPILILDLARREGILGSEEVAAFWPMIRRAAGFLVGNGPVTQQDRWEEDPGYSPFTLAVEIAALLVAAELAGELGEGPMAKYLRETADAWNDNIERWTYVTDTELARKIGVAGYYVRIGAVDPAEAASPAQGFVPIKNRPPEQSLEPASLVVSPDALALVRFGLRSANDPRILDTVRVIDARLKTETPVGPVWHRYSDDGYGEHEDGSAFDGTGVGRGWPLLVGERAHYELAAGRRTEAERLLRALEAFANPSGLIPEQVWDAAEIPARSLYPGRPTGSAMPLAWAHAEYLKLRRSLRDERVFDMPVQTTRRYLFERRSSPHAAWRFNHKIRSMPPGKVLRIEVLEPAMVHWSCDGWRSVQDTESRDTGLGVHVVDLPTEAQGPGGRVCFTFRWLRSHRWENVNYEVVVRA